MKYNILCLFKFNNYYNRKIIFYNSYSDYKVHEFLEIEDVNFNPNDSVNAHLIINTTHFDGAEFDNIPDYIVLGLNLKDYDGVESRWFVLNAVRTTGNQYDLTVRRDVVADHFETIKDCPIYVNKAHLKDDDPFIFNDEGLILNQIKTSDELINDSVNSSGWVIGYMTNDAAASNITGSPQSTPTDYTTLSAIATAIGGNMTEADLIAAINGTMEFNRDNKIRLYYGRIAEFGTKPSVEHDASSDLTFNSITYNPWNHSWMSPVGQAEYSLAGWGNIPTNNQTWLNANKATVLNAINTYHGITYHTQGQLNSLQTYNGKTILYGGRYYRLYIVSQSTSFVEFNFNSKTGLLSAMTNNAGWYSVYNDGLYYFEYNAITITLQLEEISNNANKVDISSTHNTLLDAPYSIFAIPFNSYDTFTDSNGNTFKHINGDAVLDIANAIAKELTTSKLYDLQLVPYCPLDTGFYNIHLSTYGTLHIDFDEIKNGSDTVGVIYYLKTSNFKKEIAKTLTIKDSLKVDSNCRFYRLCSPNYNGVFDFNLAKNGGSISKFYIDGTLKPYNPYFRITPEFKSLYGTNYNDGRGLICGGDFSLPIMSNAWENYQVQNKNFRDMFARDIQNLSVMQKQETFLQSLQAGAGVLTGGAAGAITGAKFGGGYGAIAGAVIGTGAGAVGGAIDVAMGNERRKEQRDYMIDRFNYSLMNIKALPDSLAKNSAFTINNKIQPFIELYEPTPQEIEAFKNKIEFDGMTVNRIGYLREFYDPDNMHYFKGQLIRWIPNWEEYESKRIDANQVNAISEELLKGVYI